MDLFSIDKETYKDGKLINGFDNVVWVERYNKEGEFTIIGQPTVEFRSSLAIGTLLSHTESETIMIVETHEIDESKDNGPILKVTGRTIDEVVMENRPVLFMGTYWDIFTDDFTDVNLEFNLVEDNTWFHVKFLLEYFLYRTGSNPNQSMPNLTIRSDISDTEVPQQKRVVPKLELLSATVRNLLSSINAGLKIERPNNDHTSVSQFVIHKGEDKSATVHFAWINGDLESARYIWSERPHKNAALISVNGYTAGEMFTLRIIPDGPTGLDLRILPVSANDWKPADFPGATDLKKVLKARGNDQISKYPKAQLVDAVISKNPSFKYNRDYKIGDIIYVDGNYDTSAKFKVVEYAVTLDETGSYGFPTLELVI